MTGPKFVRLFQRGPSPVALILLFGLFSFFETSGPVRGQEPEARFNHTAVWTGTEMIVWGGRGTNGVLNNGGRYNPITRVWTPVSTTGAPSARENQVAEWTGSEMIVWGGMYDPFTSYNDGARYNPATDTWTPMTSAGTPGGRGYHTGTWTGTHFIPWGGVTNSASGGEVYYNAGGRYSPVTNSWATTTTVGAPVARSSHTTVWTGSRMIVWGGLAKEPSASEPSKTNSGGIYNPANNTWSGTATLNAPVSRASHTAVWTGSRMIVWGGVGIITATDIFNTGGRYDPGTDSWLATSTGSGLPSVRQDHTAVWSGTEMIVWGGQGSIGNFRDTGGRYNPAADTWSGTPIGPVARAYHTAVWAGSEMIVWGGYGFSGPLQALGRYRPAENTWNTAPLCSLTAPTNGVTFGAGVTIGLVALATDTDGSVAQVQFFSGTNLLSTDNGSPFSFNWSTATTGVHSLTAVATDNTGLKATSAPVSITVSAPPAISITSPVTGTVVAENSPLTISANAGPPPGSTISQVEFYDGPALLGTDAASPFQFDWSAVPAGLHTLTARALDSLGGTATSTPVTLTGNVLPVTALTNPAPATRIVLTEPITLAATAGDGDGSITQVEFRANGLAIGADLAAPYTAEWTNSVLGAHTLVSVATDNSGMSRTSAPVAVEVLLRPKLTPVWLTNRIRVQLQGETNRSYLIQSSTNLLQWLPLSTNVATNGAFTIEDTSVTNAPPRRYYRAVP